MKKSVLSIMLTVCLLLSSTFIMSACDDGITDCAYIQFVPAIEGEVVKYTAQMYSDNGAYHIYLFESEEVKNAHDNDWNDMEKHSLLRISFNRGFGIDYEIDEKETFVAAIENWYYMNIYINKDYYYNSNTNTPKKVYLNGTDITSKADPTLSKPPSEGSHALGTFWYDGVYYFEDFGFVKSNKSNYINTIEFK